MFCRSGAQVSLTAFLRENGQPQTLRSRCQLLEPREDLLRRNVRAAPVQRVGFAGSEVDGDFEQWAGCVECHLITSGRQSDRERHAGNRA
jgi:hypothetical protein